MYAACVRQLSLSVGTVLIALRRGYESFEFWGRNSVGPELASNRSNIKRNGEIIRSGRRTDRKKTDYFSL